MEIVTALSEENIQTSTNQICICEFLTTQRCRTLGGAAALVKNYMQIRAINGPASYRLRGILIPFLEIGLGLPEGGGNRGNYGGGVTRAATRL